MEEDFRTEVQKKKSRPVKAGEEKMDDSTLDFDFALSLQRAAKGSQRQPTGSETRDLGIVCGGVPQAHVLGRRTRQGR